MSMISIKKILTKILERLVELDGFVVQDYSSGSMKSINNSGLYYIYNAVTDKPMSAGGLFAIKFSNAINANTGKHTHGSGLFLANANSNGLFAFRVSIIDGTWYYHPLHSPNVQIGTWSNIATTTASTWYNLYTFNLPAGYKYLLLARTGNGISGTSLNALSFSVNSGTAKTSALGNSGATSGQGGNHITAWYYIETDTACQVLVRTYSYNTSAKMDGRAIVIPLGVST